MAKAQNENETLLKFNNWYKYTLIVGIFVVLTSALFTTLLLIYEINRARGCYFCFKYDPIEFQLAMYIAFLVFAIFRSIWLAYMTKMSKSNRKFSLIIFNLIQIVVTIGLGIISVFGILYSIGDILQDHLIPGNGDIIFFGALAIMGLEIFAWLFFYAYLSHKIEEDQFNLFKKIRKGIMVYILTLGIPIIVIFFVFVVDRVLGPFPLDVFDIGGPVNLNYLAVFLNFLLIFMIFSNYLIGLVFQFRMVNGILGELKR